MPKTDDNLTSKTRNIKKLVDAGISIAEAYQLAQPEKPVSKRQHYQMKQKLEALALTEPKRVNAAITALDNVLKGQIIGEAKTVSTSDIISAIRIIMERAEPVVNVNKNLNVSVDLSPVDLSKYTN